MGNYSYLIIVMWATESYNVIHQCVIQVKIGIIYWSLFFFISKGWFRHSGYQVETSVLRTLNMHLFFWDDFDMVYLVVSITLSANEMTSHLSHASRLLGIGLETKSKNFLNPCSGLATNIVWHQRVLIRSDNLTSHKVNRQAGAWFWILFLVSNSIFSRRLQTFQYHSLFAK